MKSKRLRFILSMITLLFVTNMMTGCTGNANGSEKTTSGSGVTKKTDNELWKVYIKKVMRKQSKLVGTITNNIDENSNEVCTITGKDSDSLELDVDKDNKIITITSNKHRIESNGDIKININVNFNVLSIDQGNFKIDISDINTEKFDGEFQCAVSGKMCFQNNKNLNLDFEGAGKIDLEGNTEYADINIEGASTIQGKKLNAKKAKIMLEGVGYGSITAIEELTAKVEGIGIIEYYGNPKTVDKSVDGFGKVRQK